MLREAWTIAIESLSWMEMRGLSEPLAFARTVKQLAIDNPDALRLARVLVFETVRRKNFIDAFLAEAIEPAEIERLDLGTRAFLRLYVYYTRFSQDWSEADLRQAETAARAARSILGWKTLLPVEPYLGALLTQKPSTVFSRKDDESREALRTFHPKWFVEYCYKLLGRTEALAFLEANISPLPLYARLNTLKAQEDVILEGLARDGAEIDKIDRVRFGYAIVKTKKPLAKTASFTEGLIHLQDKSSMFAAEAANPSSNSTVLDICSAPGAVTTYMAQLMRNEGSILAVDYSKRRTASWKKEVSRFGVNIAEPVIADACTPLPFSTEADVIVVNPPCTDTGLFARLPSGKWRLTSHSIPRMCELQLKMLNNCSEYAKRGGTLVYFTSSITVEENEMVIEKFLKWHPEYSLGKIEPDFGLPGLRGFDRCRRLYPHIHACNGAFVARLRKT
jgi:16S rRNA (cytosine967-C5)-methyltransferase